MGTFKFRAKKGPGEVVEAIITAATKEEAVEKLSQRGYLPIRIEEVKSGSVSAPLPAQDKGIFLPKVKPRLVTVFSRQLAVLLRSGVPILSGLNILAEQSEDAVFKTVIGTVSQEIRNGKTLSLALSEFPQIFSALYISLIKAGEEGGKLEEALVRIAEYRAKQERIISSIRTAVSYPILMAVVGLGTIIFMLVFVMPRLLKIFERLGQSLPMPTKILILVSDFLRQGWPLLALIIFGLIFLVKFSLRSKKGKIFASYLKLRVPLFGGLILKAELARFSRTLELLVKSGIPLIRALQASTATLQNEIIKSELEEGAKNLEQGESLGETLKRSVIFPRFMVNLICVGEESGRLEEGLQELSLVYEAETDETIKILTNLLEPLMILIMGAVVGFIIIAMLLPVFQINMMVK